MTSDKATFINPTENQHANIEQLAIVAIANDNGVVFNNEDGVIIWVNDSFCSLIGYCREEIIGKHTLDFCRGPLTPDTQLQAIGKSIGQREKFNEQLIHYRKDGTWFWARVKGRSYQTMPHQPKNYFAVVEDITDEKNKEEELKTLSKIAEENINAVILTDRLGNITWANKSFSKITGYGLDEVLGRRPGHLLQGPLTNANTVAYLKRQITQGLPFQAEILNYAKKGQTYWLRIQGQPIYNSEGTLSGFFALEEDITNEKNATARIKEHETRFRLALEKIGDNVWEHNFNTSETWLSGLLTPSGQHTETAESFGWNVTYQEDIDKITKLYADYKTGKTDSHNLEYRIACENGVIKWILDRGAAIEFDDEHKPLRVIGIHTDITNIKNTEIALQERAMQFKALSENIPGVIYEYEFKADGTEGLRYISPAMERIFGIKAADFVNYLAYIHPEDQARILAKNEYSKQTLEPFYDESILTVPGQAPKWHSVHSSFSYTTQTGSKVFTGFMNDITERKNIEEKLKAEEEKYRNIITNMNLGLLEVDADERISFANNSFCGMSGYILPELIGQKASSLLAKTESIALFKNKLELRKHGVADAYQVKIRDKQGVDKWWLISGGPRYNDKGELVGSIGIHLDITEQKEQEAELIDARKHAEHLAQTQEIFLANMSHEIRTPMNAIMGMSNQLSKTDLMPQQRFFLDIINTASESLLIIINDILDLSKIEAGKLSIENIGFNLKNSAKRVIDVLSHKAEEKGLRITNSYFDEGISPILIGDPYRLNQILLNLVNNGVKFTEMGVIDLKFKLTKDYDDSQLIKIEVKDTGVGMGETFLKHLFDKYSQESKSASRKYGGTGLGMSICKDLVTLMGGEIFAESEKGKGSKISFTIELKKGSNDDLPDKPPAEYDTAFLKHKRVLITDDNELNRLVALVILQNYGANVTESVSGNNTLEVLKKQTFDIILMDIQMPGINGLETTRLLREAGNTSPIIALTAEAIKGEREKCIAAGMDDYITKPIDEEQFLKTLDRWIKTTKKDQSPTAMATEPLYDLSSLKALSRNNDAFIKKMIDIFCTQTPVMLTEISEAFDTGDMETIKSNVHKMKPSVDNLKIHTAMKLIKQIEHTEPENFDSLVMAENICALKSNLTEVINQIQNEYKA